MPWSCSFASRRRTLLHIYKWNLLKGSSFYFQTQSLYFLTPPWPTKRPPLRHNVSQPIVQDRESAAAGQKTLKKPEALCLDHSSRDTLARRRASRQTDRREEADLQVVTEMHLPPPRTFKNGGHYSRTTSTWSDLLLISFFPSLISDDVTVTDNAQRYTTLTVYDCGLVVSKLVWTVIRCWVVNHTALKPARRSARIVCGRHSNKSVSL